MAIREDLKNLQALIQTMDNEMSMVEDVLHTTITDVYELDIHMKDVIANKTNDEISYMTDEDVIDCLTEGFTGEGDNTNITNLKNVQSTDNDYKEKSFTEYAIHVFKDIKNSLDEINNLSSEKEKITNEVNEVSNNYFNYVNSEEYKQKKMKRVQELKEKAAEETDEKKRKEIEAKLTSIENTETLEFLYKRIDSIGQKEIDSIVDTFFTPRRSELIMTKFAARLPKYGYSKDLYKMFFNIEEKFLPEEYHDLNNVFLFVVMRYISYTDTNNKIDSLYVSSVLIKLYNLLYHRYESQDLENNFVDFIKKVDDYFMPQKERFAKYNITSPNHPQRKERDEQYEQKRRMMIIASLENEGIEVDSTLETAELRKMLQDVIDKKEKEAVTDTTTVQEVIAPEKEIEEVVEEQISSEEELSTENELMENVTTTSEMENLINTIETSEEVSELDDFMSEIDTEELKATATEVVGEVEEIPVVESEDTIEMDVEDFVKLQEIASTEESSDDEFIVERRIPQTESEVTEIEVWKDTYGCYYIEDNGKYAYCDEHDEIIEENIPEDTVLKLISGGNVTKATITI